MGGAEPIDKALSEAVENVEWGWQQVELELVERVRRRRINVLKRLATSQSVEKWEDVVT